MVLLMLTNEMKNLAKYSIKTFCAPRNLCNFTKFKRVRSSFHLPILNTSSRGYSGINGSLLDVREEVRAALNEDKAVVALESAIITHGMPSPANYETALLLEDILRKMGCVPATIGVVKGRLVVGINHEELQVLADPKQSSDKVTTRGLPLTLAKGRYGGTTVAASLTACRLAGIEVFTTGGLGGVHRPPKIGGVTWDVSADLVELGRSPGIAVVCAGVKSILDVPATLEYLETQGVTVTVLTDGPASSSIQFPDFFSRESGVLAPATVQDTEEAAHVLLAAKEIGTPGAVVVAVPTPAEYALAGNQIKEAIVESLREAERLGVRGCAVTPSVLAKLAALTGGTSVSANIGLISNNVKRGGELALSLTKIKHQNNSRRISSAVPHLPPSPPYKQQEQMSARSAGGDHPVCS